MFFWSLRLPQRLRSHSHVCVCVCVCVCASMLGKGEGFNLNVPLPPGTVGEEFNAALEKHALPRITDFAPDVLLVSLGTDTARADPEVCEFFFQKN